MLKYKPKRNARLQDISRMTYFHLECQKPIKKSNNVFFWHNNLIVFINATFFMKNIQYL
jgi:hypothetical protein